MLVWSAPICLETSTLRYPEKCREALVMVIRQLRERALSEISRDHRRFQPLDALTRLIHLYLEPLGHTTGYSSEPPFASSNLRSCHSITFAQF